MPLMQCQHYRTGLLCSQCVTGYIQHDMHLGYHGARSAPTSLSFIWLLGYLFTGLLLTIMLFSVNLTVTYRIEILTLYANDIQINC